MTVEAVAAPVSRKFMQKASSEAIAAFDHGSGFNALLQQAAQSNRTTSFNALVAALDDADSSGNKHAAAQPPRHDTPQPPEPAAPDPLEAMPSPSSAPSTGTPPDAARTAATNGRDDRVPAVKKQSKPADRRKTDPSAPVPMAAQPNLMAQAKATTTLESASPSADPALTAAANGGDGPDSTAGIASGHPAAADAATGNGTAPQPPAATDTAGGLAATQAAALAQAAGSAARGTVKVTVKAAGGDAPTPTVTNAASLHQLFSPDAGAAAGAAVDGHSGSAPSAGDPGTSSDSGSGTDTGGQDQSAQTQAAQGQAAQMAAAQPFTPGLAAGGTSAVAASPNSMESQVVAATGATAGHADDAAATATLPVAPAGAQNLAQADAAGDTPAVPPPRQPLVVTPADQIKVQLARNLKEGNDTISVQLHPEDLGRVEVKLEMRDGQVKATITADRPETLQMLKNDAGNLQQALQNAGLNADANSLNFQLRGDQQGRQGAREGRGAPRERRAGPAATAIDAVGAPQGSAYGSGSAADSGVDISV